MTEQERQKKIDAIVEECLLRLKLPIELAIRSGVIIALEEANAKVTGVKQ